MNTNIKVIGVGAGGGYAVNRMIEAGVTGVEFICMNTDVQILEIAMATRRLLIGAVLTEGRGAGGDPEVGRAAAEESRREIEKLLEGADMVFVTAGMGGGTGTGAAPVIAGIAQDAGALTLGVVTKPFTFEGPRRRRIAEAGIASLRPHLDTLVTIPNDRLLLIAAKRSSLPDAFRLADDILRQCVQGVSDIITIAGLIKVDFDDVKAIVVNAGPATMGIGTGRGANRVTEAAERAITSPLQGTPIQGVRGLLINVTAGPDLMLEEIEQACAIFDRLAALEDAPMVFGAVIDDRMSEDVRVTVLATGASPEAAQPVVLEQTRVPPRWPGYTLDVPPPTMMGGRGFQVPRFLRGTQDQSDGENTGRPIW